MTNECNESQILQIALHLKWMQLLHLLQTVVKAEWQKQSLLSYSQVATVGQENLVDKITKFVFQ